MRMGLYPPSPRSDRVRIAYVKGIGAQGTQSPEYVMRGCAAPPEKNLAHPRRTGVPDFFPDLVCIVQAQEHGGRSPSKEPCVVVGAAKPRQQPHNHGVQHSRKFICHTILYGTALAKHYIE